MPGSAKSSLRPRTQAQTTGFDPNNPAIKAEKKRFWRDTIRSVVILSACISPSIGAFAVEIPVPPKRPFEFGLAPTIAPPPVVSIVEPVKTPPGVPPNASTAEIVARIDAALNQLTTLTADFVQTSGNQRLTGQLYIQKPGRLRFDYDLPARLEIIADGSSVAVRDRKLATQDIYPIGQTPLKFLTRGTIDIARDFAVIGTRVDPDHVIIALEDRSTFAGTSKITLFFEQPALMLRQWTIVDPQGNQVSVVLNALNTTKRPDPKLFVIENQSGLDVGTGR
jgi:outer membrane lipoprotein-sorting protein